MKTTADRQHGFSMSGFLLIAVAVILAAIFGMKLIPPYMHSARIAQIFKEIAADPAMQNAPIKEIKDSYSKRADIDDITDITADDIEISKGDGQLRLSVSYSAKIPLAGNATLLLEFNPSSS